MKKPNQISALFFCTFLVGLISMTAFAGPVKKAQAIPGCQNEGLAIHSENLEGTLTHLHGFDEIRHFLDAKAQSGVEICANTAVLDNNIYQYFLNFVIYQIKDTKNKTLSRLAVLYQHSSIQGHHGTSLRPWIVITLNKFRSWMETELSEFQSVKTIEGVEKNVGAAVQKELGKGPSGAIQFSVIPWTLENGDQLFVATWLERLSDPSSGLYTQFYAPKRKLILYQARQQRLEISGVSSAFGLMQILENERLGLEAQAPLDGPGKLRMLEGLVETTPAP